MCALLMGEVARWAAAASVKAPCVPLVADRVGGSAHTSQGSRA